MIQDNQKFTAMRLFQEIKGADAFYVNTYSATTPRLSVFKGICNTVKEQNEEEVNEESWDEISKIEIPNVKEILKKKSQLSET